MNDRAAQGGVSQACLSLSCRLSVMGEEELSKQKAALAANKLQRDRALAEEAGRHWDHISNER